MKRYSYEAKHKTDGSVIVVEGHNEATRASFTGWLDREGYVFTETVTDYADPSTELSDAAKAERAAERLLKKQEAESAPVDN